MESAEKLDAIDKKLDTIIELCKSNKGTEPKPSFGLTIRPDGIATGTVRVTTDPKQWSSGRGAFFSYKDENSNEWVSIGVSNNVAEKVHPGYFPQKGDIVTIRGKYEEQTNPDTAKVYKSVFAFVIAPGTSIPRSEPKQAQPPLPAPKPAPKQQVDDNDDIPF